MPPNPTKYFIHPYFAEEAKLFLEEYKLVKIVLQGDERYSKRNLKGYSSRTCRFCGLTYPDTSFSNLSHLLPQLIGNANLYSDFECDHCNSFFSGLENDLAEYLGISRSISSLHSEKKPKGFTGHRLNAKSRNFNGDKISILAPEDVKTEGDVTHISYTKNPFIPSNAYKALLKSALSILTDVEIEQKYRQSIGYLQGKANLTGGAIIWGYRLPFSINLPLHVLCFRRKVANNAFPEYIISFYFQNHIISLPIPWDGNMEWRFGFPPPFFFDEKLMYAVIPVPFIRDLGLNTRVENEEETIMFQRDPEFIKNLRCYDPATDTYKEERFNPANLKHLVITKAGVTVDPKALSAFLKKEMDEGK